MNIEWMAGFFDGEGSIIISIKRPRTTFLVARIGNTYFPAVRFFMRFGGNLHYVKRIKGYRPMLVWMSSYADAERCIKALLPYLVVKKKQAQLALKYCIYRRKMHKNGYGQGYRLPDSTVASDLAYRKEMSRLNHGRRFIA
jgi:hypothetical protein